jgi:hypothetical protein
MTLMDLTISCGDRFRQSSARSPKSPEMPRAAGSSEISAHIGGVTTAAAATGLAATDVLSNARELDNQSGMLRSAVDGFLTKVRAA